jgi:hypothetical protein
MCEHHTDVSNETPDALLAEFLQGGARRKLWENDPQFNCSIVGTCLTMGELRKIGRKVRIAGLDGKSEMELHSFFVRSARGEGDRKVVARLMQKTLERKFHATVNRFDKAKTEGELAELWRQAREAGDIPGPYWAIVTHPAATENLVEDVFGHVHMLSHLVGASNRADLRRLKELEAERDALAEELAAVKFATRERTGQRLDIEDRLAESQAAGRRLEETVERLQALADGSEVEVLRATVERLHQDLDERTRRAEAAERQLAKREGQVGRLTRSVERLDGELGEIRIENAALEQLLDGGTKVNCDGDCEGCDECVDAPVNVDLAGRRILYVGGRGKMTRHFRALVERSNGEFIHHDGGLEDAQSRLDDILARCDAVLCPMDCVSHAASQRTKKYCKRYAKPVVMLRSSGISSFTRGLHQLANGPSATVTTQA